VAGCGVEDMAAKTPGWRGGSSPEAAKRCAALRRALRAKDSPVRMNVGELGHSGWDGDGSLVVCVGSPFKCTPAGRGKRNQPFSRCISDPINMHS
jgi:hypothetical protein